MNAVDILKYGHLTLLGSLEGLPDAAWALPGACGEYSVQTLVAHMATMEDVLADALGAFAGEPEGAHFAAYVADQAGYEAAERARFAALPPAAALAEYQAAHDRVMRHAAAIPTATLRTPGTIPWYGAEYALDDLIVYFNYGHKREHAGQIGLFRDAARAS
jgi:hypothetical protein